MGLLEDPIWSVPVHLDEYLSEENLQYSPWWPQPAATLLLKLLFQYSEGLQSCSESRISPKIENMICADCDVFTCLLKLCKATRALSCSPVSICSMMLQRSMFMFWLLMHCWLPLLWIFRRRCCVSASEGYLQGGGWLLPPMTAWSLDPEEPTRRSD